MLIVGYAFKFQYPYIIKLKAPLTLSERLPRLTSRTVVIPLVQTIHVKINLLGG